MVVRESEFKEDKRRVSNNVSIGEVKLLGLFVTP